MEFPSDPFDATRPFMPTIGDRLSAKDISWKWYYGSWDNCPSRKSRSTLNQRITDQTCNNVTRVKRNMWTGTGISSDCTVVVNHSKDRLGLAPGARREW